MPDYTIRDPQSGRTMTVRGDSPPTESELVDLFAKAAPPSRASTAPGVAGGKPYSAEDFAPKSGAVHPMISGLGKALLNQPMTPDELDAVGKLLPAAGGAIGGTVGGVPGSVAGGVVGESVRQLHQDAVKAITGQPQPTTPQVVTGLAKEGAIQGAAQGVGTVVGAMAKPAASWLMQSALKPTLTVLKEYGTTAPKIVKTLLDEGVNVTPAGISRLQTLLTATNDEIRAAVAGATGTISKNAVAARVLPTAAKLSQQVNAGADLAQAGDAVTQFIDHPVYNGSTLTVPEAQAMKVGTYQQIGKKYGEVSSAGIETQKALARGLKEEIAAEVPGVQDMNQRDSQLMAALDAVGRRVAISGNRDPVGFAWVAQHPTTFLAALMDRNPAVKSMLARGLYQSAGTAANVSPQLIRAAVVALTSAGSAPEPAQK